jgi:hypothetical protein
MVVDVVAAGSVDVVEEDVVVVSIVDVTFMVVDVVFNVVVVSVPLA